MSLNFRKSSFLISAVIGIMDPSSSCKRSQRAATISLAPFTNSIFWGPLYSGIRQSTFMFIRSTCVGIQIAYKHCAVHYLLRLSEGARRTPIDFLSLLNSSIDSTENFPAKKSLYLFAAAPIFFFPFAKEILFVFSKMKDAKNYLLHPRICPFHLHPHDL
jgi:hypothetical protein